MTDVLHEHLEITGCSDSDEEYMQAVDAEEMFHADFKAGTIEDGQPSFLPEHLGFSYPFAQGVLQICRVNLGIMRKLYKNISLEKGKRLLSLSDI
ncbi:hypothetical protein JOQ06_024794 [Pogonophryne albipinna]|uniref:MHC class II alpha chain N-terminal domain-containing protein n=1 Tax=Pogonophryne albipinna TaxID=1090488 RepID=A0AAD6A694_9TELE|nr:hypothetical protein JOQ06_024794 [Pogonophryne albipinna]